MQPGRQSKVEQPQAELDAAADVQHSRVGPKHALAAELEQARDDEALQR